MIGKWAIATVVTTATVLGYVAAPAGAISLGSLLGGGTLETGDKIFGEFSCVISSDPITNTPTSCDDIDVSIIPQGSGNGLKFSGNFFAEEGDQSFIDVLIEYVVTAKPNTEPFKNIGLSFMANLSNPDSIATITETVNALNGDSLGIGFLTVFAPDDLSDPAYEADQDIPLSTAVFQARVTKDIYLSNGASISMITQTYETPIPEPATVGGLLGLGALGLGAILKRNQQGKA